MSAKLPKLNLENLESSQEEVIRISPQISDVDSDNNSDEPTNEPSNKPTNDPTNEPTKISEMDEPTMDENELEEEQKEQELMDTLKTTEEAKSTWVDKEETRTTWDDDYSDDYYSGSWSDPVDKLFPHVSTRDEWASPVVEMPPEEECPSTPSSVPSTPMCSKTPPRSVLDGPTIDEVFHGQDDLEKTPSLIAATGTPSLTPHSSPLPPDTSPIVSPRKNDEEPILKVTPRVLELSRYRDIRIPYVNKDAIEELEASKVTSLSDQFHFVFNDDDGLIVLFGIPKNPLITYDDTSSSDNDIKSDSQSEPSSDIERDIKEAVESDITSIPKDDDDDIDQEALDLMEELERKNDPTLSPVSQVSPHTIPRKYIRGKKILLWGACAFIPVVAAWATQWLIN